MLRTLVAVALTGILFGAAAALAADDRSESSWTFNVFLDDAQIGYHEYRLIERADGLRQVEATARSRGDSAEVCAAAIR